MLHLEKRKHIPKGFGRHWVHVESRKEKTYTKGFERQWVLAVHL
jgi:hypothetical protein